MTLCPRKRDFFIRRLRERFLQWLPVNGRSRRSTAQATAALCVGGMVVARAMDNREIADELRDACMAVALELGGWDEGATQRDT